MPGAVNRTVSEFLTELDGLLQAALAGGLELPSAWAERISGFQLDAWQRALMDKPLHDTLLVCARQTGKSTTTALLAAYHAAHRSARVVVIAPSQRQSSLAYRKVEQMIKADPSVSITRATATVVELANGGTV